MHTYVCMYSTAQRQHRTRSQLFLKYKELSSIESQAFSAQQVVNTRLEMQQYASIQIIIEMFT